MKKFNLISACLVLLSGLCFHLQAQTWQWASGYGDIDYEYSNDACRDADGNLIVVGAFGGDSLVMGTTVLYNGPNIYNEMFVAKFDSMGVLIWAQKFGGSQDEFAYSVVTDNNNNIWICGTFNSNSLVLGSFTLNNASNITDDAFLLKLGPAGNVLWAGRIGGTDNEDGKKITLDSAGNVIIAGDFASPILSIGGTSFTNTNSGTDDIFIAGYDSLGNFIWAATAGGSGGTGYEELYGLAADNHGNVYLGGIYGSATMTIGTQALTNTGGYDIFLSKFKFNGNFDWAVSAGGSTSSDYLLGIAVDGFNNVYTCGRFYSKYITFGNFNSTNNDTITFTSDYFLAKYNISGAVTWLRTGGSDDNEAFRDIKTDAEGNITAGGWFESDSVYLAGSWRKNTTNNSQADALLVNFDSSGVQQSAQTFGGNSSDFITSMAINGKGDLFVCGSYSSSLLSMPPYSLPGHSGSQDFFVARLSGLTAGINTPRTYENILLYPNPNQGEFYLSVPEDWQFPLTFELMNSTGQLIRKWTLYQAFMYGNNYPVTVKEKDGLYFLRVNSVSRSTLLKVIISAER